MAVNEVALSFEKSDYYTLQEAESYLSLTNNIDNITPKKLLQAIVKYDIDVYIYGKGFGVQVDFDTPFVHKEEYLKNRDIIISETKSLESDLSFYAYYHGLLFQLDNEVKRKLIFKNVTYGYDVIENDLFCGVLDLENTDKDPTDLNFIIGINKKSIKYKILALYPIFCFEYYDYGEQNLIGILPKLKELPENQDELPLLHITINDLIILHKDLIKLESNILNDSPAPQKPMAIKPRKGVSVQKLQAKEQANLIAKALWNNDKENKIRIAEMARIVYAELFDNGFFGQLPQNQDSLQDWIKDIAPPYARQGGRPTNN